MKMMGAARVDLNGALIRPVDNDPYNQQGWGSPQARPWWTAYNVGSNPPTATANTQAISGGSLIGNAIKQGWSAMVSPRAATNESATEVKAPTGALAQNPFDKTPTKTETKPTVAPPVATQPTPPVAVTPTPISSVLVPQTIIPPTVPQAVIPTVTGVQQPTLVPGMPVPTGQPTIGTGFPVSNNPAIGQPPTTGFEAIIAQLQALKKSNEDLTKEVTELKTQSVNKPVTGATLACGCPAPTGKGAGDCKCTTKTEATKKADEKKLVKKTEKTTPIKKTHKTTEKPSSETKKKEMSPSDKAIDNANKADKTYQTAYADSMKKSPNNFTLAEEVATEAMRQQEKIQAQEKKKST
jgi:hypothetical protein